MEEVFLTNGPCEGHYEIATAPERLRAVLSSDGIAAVLDLPEDDPLLGEQVHVYVRLALAFTCGRDAGGCRVTWWYELLAGSDLAEPLRAV